MKKGFISLMIFVVVGAAIYLCIGLFSNNPPKPIITAQGKKIESAQGSYCWGGALRYSCVDMISPPELINFEKLKPVAVSPESQVKIEFKKEPIEKSLTVKRWVSNEEAESVSMSGNVLIAPEEKGVYVYDVSASWERGSAGYAFVIEVR